MRVAVEENLAEILKFLENDLGNCLYIYLDIKHYGIGDNLRVWINDEGTLRTIVMRYHDSLQIYSTGLERERNAVVHIIEQENVRMISGEKNLIESIFPDLKCDYHKTSGLVHEIRQFREFEYPEGFGIAEKEEMQEMAELVCTDYEIGGHYEVQDLAKQFVERMQMGMGRNYYVKKDGVLQAHIATYAEDDKVAVTSGMVAKADAVPFGCGTILESNLVNDLLHEGKRVFTFTTNPRRGKYLCAMGAETYAEYAKLEKM